MNVLREMFSLGAAAGRLWRSTEQDVASDVHPGGQSQDRLLLRTHVCASASHSPRLTSCFCTCRDTAKAATFLTHFLPAPYTMFSLQEVSEEIPLAHVLMMPL
ncbi:hypothetical protein AAFF_G00235990 [Aldrovandia affinis]|uniref:Uncharacterized protein n=1 Tax=Aldrovandia affinis TaxID=143900 RepID=A0AAD7REL4_9TELE|nr:hypothetical protein AAFF_G00235990 [Aldrovandia affinis]